MLLAHGFSIICPLEVAHVLSLVASVGGWSAIMLSVKAKLGI